MKKRIALVALSAVLVFSLTIGGTLMLFTAQSEKATNVVTVGDLGIDLYENGTKVDAAYTGLEFDNAAPGVDLDKRPTVKHTGGVDAYVRVKATLHVYAPDGTEIYDGVDHGYANLLTNAVMINGTQSAPYTNPTLKNAAAYLAGLYNFNNITLGNNWVFEPDLPRSVKVLGTQYNVPTAAYTGYFYYIDDASQALKTLSGDAETQAVFDKISLLPIKDVLHFDASEFVVTQIDSSTNTDGSIDAAEYLLAGYKIEIELQAQAVQVNGNIGTGTDYASYFDYQSLQN
jgi:predicted ribosomally synthesized peptide with SipW-like signal peptide